MSSKTVSLRVNDSTETAILLSAAALQTYAREPLSFRVALDRARLPQASGNVTIDWGDGRGTNVGEITGSTSVEHTFREPGNYRVVASVTAPNGKGGRSDVRIRVEPRLTADIDLTADVGFVGEPTVFTIAARLSNGAAPNGTATLDYGDGATVTGAVTGGSAEATNTYVNEGTYTARITFQDDAGRAASGTLKVVVKIEDDGGGGDGGGGDGGGGDGGGGSPDEIDLSQVVFLNYNISGWPITSTLTSVSISAGEICMPHTKAGKWPTTAETGSGVTVEANTWVIANVNGTWYAAIFEWQVPGWHMQELGLQPTGHDSREPDEVAREVRAAHQLDADVRRGGLYIRVGARLARSRTDPDRGTKSGAQGRLALSLRGWRAVVKVPRCILAGWVRNHMALLSHH